MAERDAYAEGYLDAVRAASTLRADRAAVDLKEFACCGRGLGDPHQKFCPKYVPGGEGHPQGARCPSGQAMEHKANGGAR